MSEAKDAGAPFVKMGEAPEDTDVADQNLVGETGVVEDPNTLLKDVQVLPDDFVGPLAPDQIRQSEYDAANQTLQDIQDGKTQITVDGTAGFRKDTMNALGRLMSRPTGRALVYDLATGPHNTKIIETTGGNSLDFVKQQDSTTIEFNPARTKLNGETWMERDPAIGLGHELIHSHHVIHGTLATTAFVRYKDASGKIRSAPGAELQAVGLGKYTKETFTENRLRSEHDQDVSILPRDEVSRPRY